MKNKKISTNAGINWHDETGRIPFRMTNDYLFRALMQNNNKVLRSLIAALLGWDKSKIKSAVIENPINLGDSLDSKTYVLDVRVQVNNDLTLNLELQVINAGNWPERSLVYLCRIFDSLNRGSNYEDIKPAYHIGILDFNLFPNKPVFKETFNLYGSKTQHIYTDKFSLSVVCLPNIELATEEDRSSHLTEWASMFKATKWEELHMLAQKNPDIDLAITSMYMLYQDDNIRDQMIAREEYYAHENYMKKTIEDKDKALEEKDKALVEKDKALEEKDKALVEKDKALVEKDKALVEKDKALVEKDKALEKKDKTIEDLTARMAKLEALFATKD